MIKTKKWRDAEKESSVTMCTEDWMADEIDGLREELASVYKQRAELLEALNFAKNKIVELHEECDEYEFVNYAIIDDAITKAEAAE